VPDERTDEQLLEDYRAGDAATLRTLIDRHHDALMRFLTRFLGDRQAAEDVFQDAFLQVHLSAESFDVSRRFKPWLFTIAANKARDSLRKSRRTRALDLSAPIGGAGAEGGRTFLDLMEVDVPPPGAASDDRDRDRLVQACVDSLPPHLREILLLAYFQRMSYANIAEGLGVPLGTVKSRLHAAVAAFARAWATKYDPERGGSASGEARGSEGASGNAAGGASGAGRERTKRKRAANE
jgi:RNA polymerase sigma-70 factor (ECF subfamily)